MIDARTFGAALSSARRKTREERTNCARLGMLGVLEAFTRDSAVARRSRSTDGMAPIDAAVTSLTRHWQSMDGAGEGTERSVEAILKACDAWTLESRKVMGISVNNNARSPAVHKLYWQVAWAYSCDHYRKRARPLIGSSRVTGRAVTMTAPVDPASALGNPYHFTIGDSRYRTHFFQQPAVLLRGDTRGPNDINDAGGFLPRKYQSRWEYGPWFEGHSTGETISTTTDEQIAVEAPRAAKSTGRTAEGAVPMWLNEVCEVLGKKRRGFVYELGGLRGLPATYRAEDPLGQEHIFLAIPNACITNWWFVLEDARTVGPFPYQFPLPATAPTTGGVSHQPHTLA